jgi:serine/threonine protein phosphatase PrpC
MTRSFGDLVAASVGVSSVPEVTCNPYHNPEYTMNHNDRIIVIASDGVWEFLSS